MNRNIWGGPGSFPTHKKTKHSKLGLGDIISSYMSKDSSNKIESQKWLGLDDSSDEKMQDLLYRSDFITERISAGIDSSKFGRVVPILVMIENEWVIEHFIMPSAVINKNRILLKEGDVVTAYRTPKYNGFNGGGWENKFFTWQWENGRIVCKAFEEPSDFKSLHNKKNKLISTFIYPEKVKSFPGLPVRNNAKSTPDWYNVVEILQEINVLSNDLGPEWEYTKTQLASLANLNNGKQSNDIENDIENGQRVHPFFNPNSKLGISLQTMISGSTSVQILVSQIAYLEDRALKFAFQGRDMDSSGNNKHNMQVGMFNQAHGEYLSVKARQRERDYYAFFKEIVEPITGIIAPNKINILSSEFEEGKKEGMRLVKEQADMAKAQAKLQDSQANKTKEETKFVGKETKTKKPDKIV